MKKSLLFAAAAAALSLSSLCAQSFESVRVNFDKAVEIAGTNVPAGEYTITMIKSNGDVPLLRFQSDHGVNVVAFASREYLPGNVAAARTEVILDHVSGVEQVTRIEIEGSSTEYVLPLTHHNN